MSNTAIFTITRREESTGYFYSIKCRRFNQYNLVHVHERTLAQQLSHLADIFNNVLNIAILFEIDF